MDTSGQYIEMCEKAEEIQREHKWEDGDCALFTGAGDLDPYIYHSHCEGCCWEAKELKYIWLPRQDQLQEMELVSLEANVYTLHTFFNEFIERYYGHNVYPCDIFASMEQLWLAFVMKAKFGKVWNGEDWV